MLSFESPVQTMWHSIAISWKLLVVLIATALLFVYDSLEVQVFAVLACMAAYLIGGWPFFIAGAQRLRFIWPFVLVILAWHAFSGTTQQGFAIALRLVAILGISNLMTMTSRLSELIGLLHTAMAPLRRFGLNTRPVEIAIALVVRFTPEFISKAGLLQDAWRMRSSKKPTWRLVFPLSLAAIDDAEQVADALKARGGTLATQKQIENQP